MIKTSLPVIFLNGIVLLPHSEITLELNKDLDKNIIDQAQKSYQSHILIVMATDSVKENEEFDKLPKLGVVSKITKKVTLPNGNFRITITGVNRAKIFNYLETEEDVKLLLAIIGAAESYDISLATEKALIKNVINAVDGLFNNNPEIYEEILKIDSISKLTDFLTIIFPLSYERRIEMLHTLNPHDRALMLIQDIADEKASILVEQDIDRKLQFELDKNQREFVLREKIRIIKEELGDVSNKDTDVDVLREKIEKIKAPKTVKDKLNNELKKYEMLNMASPEVNMIRTYIDTLLSLPWNKYSKDTEDLSKIKLVLDNSHYGLDKIKERIIEYIAVKRLTNSLRSPIICLVGPPGVGKTSLAKSIANSLNRKFVKISVGGVNDEAEIMGHRRTYLGSAPGRIISAMKKSGTCNPVFLIDEVDKMVKDYKGDPASALLEVLDKEQNKYFVDHYVEEEYDLSNVMFILTANYLYEIPEALRDRLEIIDLSGYTEYEKLGVAKNHLVITELKEHGLEDKGIKFTDEAILTIIRNYTKEAGVRELERKIAQVCRKLAKEILESNKSKKILITEKNIEKYLGKKRYQYNNSNENGEIGVVNGLAYTVFGGDILPIEVTLYKGKGNLVLTGSLGDVMKESANIALGYIKSHAKEFKIDYKLIENNDIHINVPEGAVPKDGPSAGTALTTSIISALTNKKVDSKIGMTGEITLRGNVLPIGGLKEKSIGAARAGLNKIFIPKENECDLDEIPKEVKDVLEIKLVSHYSEIYEELINN